MGSGGEFFRFVCELAAGGPINWNTVYPDLAGREAMWGFLYEPLTTPQARVDPLLNRGHIVHTIDENFVSDFTDPEIRYTDADPTLKYHVIGMRPFDTPLLPGTGTGAKMVFYNTWANCSTAPPLGEAPEEAFYDYSANRREMGIDVGNGLWP